MHKGSVAVGSNGRTIGGMVPGGSVLSVLSASELTSVRAAAGSMSSRNIRRTMLMPVIERDSTLTTRG